jgi:hypothetical protein
MRRTRYVGITLGVLLLALAVGTTMWWRSASTRRVSGAGDLPAAVPTATASTFELVLQVNRMTTAAIPGGASAFFTVTLTGHAPESWTPGLRFETSAGKPLAFRIDPLGPPITLEGGDRERPGSAMRQAEFGISPEEAERLSTGSHTIRAVLPLANATSDRRPLVSNTVTLAVGAPEAGAMESTNSEKARLASAARFNLLSEKWEEAHLAALRLVEREDADTPAFILLGDALNGLKRDEEALAAYHEALALLPRDLDESPDYLLARMEEVQQRLEAAKAKK